jgi:hypothetical protein
VIRREETETQKCESSGKRIAERKHEEERKTISMEGIHEAGLIEYMYSAIDRSRCTRGSGRCYEDGGGNERRKEDEEIPERAAGGKTERANTGKRRETPWIKYRR